ncbi:hypothetical protein PMIN02_006948 [Paraphaeosphaeria minitans]
MLVTLSDTITIVCEIVSSTRNRASSYCAKPYRRCCDTGIVLACKGGRISCSRSELCGLGGFLARPKVGAIGFSSMPIFSAAIDGFQIFCFEQEIDDGNDATRSGREAL